MFTFIQNKNVVCDLIGSVCFSSLCFSVFLLFLNMTIRSCIWCLKLFFCCCFFPLFSLLFFINWIRIMHFFVFIVIYLTDRLCSFRTHHIAYFRVHSRASSLYFSRSVLYILAISGVRGSSGFGSHRREQIDNRTAMANMEREKKIEAFH